MGRWKFVMCVFKSISFNTFEILSIQQTVSAVTATGIGQAQPTCHSHGVHSALLLCADRQGLKEWNVGLVENILNSFTRHPTFQAEGLRAQQTSLQAGRY